MNSRGVLFYFILFSENDSCLHPSGKTARCRLKSKCAEVAVLIDRGIKPVPCGGHHETEALVCCQVDPLVSTLEVGRN